ncbi:hypothetical protein [Streptomyces sp. MA15]|uniref:hypothetical protein n=1 Tax=Streptomyces sp. MA15 TaxID=3055061 RepID=UPI0025AFC83A|nr:hypothetical protein [Streptomyces sp. MA15]MDN3270902.1 hypothetical protein [Streptomyces sp. MA15]
MLKSFKITVLAGVLGSSALIGLGAVQAVAVESPGKCTNDGKGHVRCADVRKERVTSEENGVIHLVNAMKQECSGSNAKVSCATRVIVDGEES